jgi:hypothetical protein
MEEATFMVPTILVNHKHWSTLSLADNQWIHLITENTVFLARAKQTHLDHCIYSRIITRPSNPTEKALIKNLKHSAYIIRPWKIKLPNAKTITILYHLEQDIDGYLEQAMLKVIVFNRRILNCFWIHTLYEMIVQLLYLINSE